MPSALAISFSLLALGTNPGWPLADPETPAEALTSTAAMPDDPDYRPHDDPRVTCGGQLGLYSFVPDCARAITSSERPRGTGVHADRAWLWTIGRPEARIAFLDEGIDWSDRDLAEKIALNEGELPPPGPSAKYDTNGDGSFDVRDYAASELLLARMDGGDANANGFLDPQDLIMIFSDNADGDGNSYADDIAGWDFLDGDPDPGISTASPLISAAVATANNGIAGAGACPGCSAIAARVAVSGLAGGLEMSRAIAYAADRGARLIATAAASAGGSQLVGEALDYAEMRGVLVVAFAGLSGTPLREGPWQSDRVLIVGSIDFNDVSIDRATTAFARDPCSGYGKHVSIAAPGRCDTRAIGIAAGALGLAISTSLGIPSREVPALDPPLSARELHHLAIDGADGGRLNARAMVDAVIRRRVAPEAALLLPEENAVLDPTPATGIAVSGRVNNVRSTHASWVLEWAPGREPDAAAFSAITSGTLDAGQGADVAGIVPTLSIFSDPTAPPSGGSSADFEITIRLVTTAAIGAELARAEARRVVSVHRDLELLPAFPIALGVETIGAPRAIDLDRDGAEDIAVVTDDGAIHGLDVRGRVITSFPIRTGDNVVATLSAGALAEAQNDPVLVLATAGGHTLLYERTGGLLHDRASAFAASSPPVIEDLDGDREREVVIVEGQRLFAIRGNGNVLPGYPVELPERTGSISVGDVDRDGSADIAISGREHAFLIRGRDGVMFEGWPVTVPVADEDAPAYGTETLRLPATALGDVDRDGRLDVVIASRGSRAVAFDSSGRSIVVTRTTGLGEEIALGDLDGDGFLDLVRADDRAVAIFSLADGAPLSTAPFMIAGRALGGAAIGDLDGDGRPEAIFDGGDGTIEAINFDGTRPRSWPKLVGDSVLATPQLGDLDGDGLLEVIAVTRGGRVFAWRTRAAKNPVAWGGARHDPRATGNFETPSAVLTDLSVSSDCSCTTSSSKQLSAVLLLLALHCTRRVASAKRNAAKRPRLD